MAAIPTPARSNDSVERAIDAERVALLYRLTPMTLVTAVIFSIVVFFSLRSLVSTTVLVAWLVANNVVTLIRALDILAYRRAAPSIDQVGYWHRRFVALTLCAGTIWGMMGTLLFPAGTIYQAIVVVFLIGTVSVGLFTLSSSWIAYAALALPTLVPPAIFIIAERAEGGLAFGGALLFYALLVVINSRRSVRNTVEMLRLRFDNARIAAERERALQAAEDAGRARLQFLANMSHEIRTPLNGILGMAQLLESTPLDAVQTHRLGAINASGRHLLTLINDILDFSKMDAGKLDIVAQPFELRRLPREVFDLLIARAQERSVRLSYEVTSASPDWLCGDPGRIKQILLNLVGNAIKFTDQGEVELRVGLAGPAPVADTVRLRFTVRDTGVGVPAEDHGKLFQAFRQVDASATRRHGGTGLGLAISKQLVELMGGEIGCESQPGQGSTFWFELPLALAPPPVPVPASVGRQRRTRFAARVLVAEDNPVNSEVATIMLEELGITVVRAEDGRQALANAQADDFDLILMDCQMPEMDGFEATRRIIAHERTHDLPHTPIVALTGNAIRGDREACLEAGMDDYLAKPFEFGELFAVLNRWLPNGVSTERG